MILAGIDEAGYGPLLGPLVVGCCAFELPDGPDDVAVESAELPCLWRVLAKVVSKRRIRNGRKLHVNDSKQVYSPGLGLKELERSVLAMTTAMSVWPGGERLVHADLSDFLRQVAHHVLPELAAYPWYRAAPDERFPITQEMAGIGTIANALCKEMQARKTHCIHLAARVVPEKQLNKLCDQTRNKSNALFSTSAIHLDHLLRNFGSKQLTIVCDRHGGREHYGPLLRQMFEDWSLEILFEKDSRSEYRLLKDGHGVRIIFSEKAESISLPVAMASMLSKYVREALMRRFNAYWQILLPDVAPTAGYYNDGSRFLRDIDAKRRELGVRDEDLVRSR